MKKFLLLFTAALMVGGTAFAQEDNGALGFGIISESSNSGIVSKNLRFSMMLDAGSKLFGPLYYGFELQGDVKKLDQTSQAFKTTDVTAVGIDYNTWVLFITNKSYTETYTLWDLDLSPRGYISFDLGSKIQLLGFAGINYNWQTLDYDVKFDNGKSYAGSKFGSATLDSNGEYHSSTDLGGTFDLIAGARLTVGAFYLDYTRFLKADSTGDYSFNQFNKNRWGLGINLRF
jgi:hypothetical protein